MAKIPKAAQQKLEAMLSAAKKSAAKPKKRPADEDVSLNSKQVAKRLSKAKEGAITMRKQLWPDVEESALWLREDRTKKGFTTIAAGDALFH